MYVTRWHKSGRLPIVEFKDRHLAVLPSFGKYASLFGRRKRVADQDEMKFVVLASRCYFGSEDAEITR